MKDRQLAKRIILGIVHQAGGVFTNQTNLYKAFYHAHVKYADENPGFLSSWPIVRMPRGPGIHRGKELLAELLNDGDLDIRGVPIGKKVAMQFVIKERAIETASDFSDEAIAAIRYGVTQVENKTADQVSHDSHEKSRSWRNAKDGQELPIYTDSFSEEQYNQADARGQRAADILRRLG